MEVVRVAWPTAREEAWPPQGLSRVVMVCGRFGFPASGQLGHGDVRVYHHGDIVVHT